MTALPLPKMTLAEFMAWENEQPGRIDYGVRLRREAGAGREAGANGGDLFAFDEDVADIIIGGRYDVTVFNQ